jgi:hypothetical protein
MRTFLARLRARGSRAHLLAVASAAVAVSLGIVLTLTSTAQANNEPGWLQPAPVTQPLQARPGPAILTGRLAPRPATPLSSASAPPPM